MALLVDDPGRGFYVWIALIELTTSNRNAYKYKWVVHTFTNIATHILSLKHCSRYYFIEALRPAIYTILDSVVGLQCARVASLEEAANVYRRKTEHEQEHDRATLLEAHVHDPKMVKLDGYRRAIRPTHEATVTPS